MNFELRESIVRHIFANLAIIPSTFISVNKTKSLRDKEFLLDEKLEFEIDDMVIKNKVWGCQISSDQQELKMLLGDCTQDKDIPEFCLIIQLKNAPAYGVYLVCSDQVDNEALIACSLNGKDWLECNTFLQASFLAGMENMKDVGLNWQKCKEHDEHYKMMLTFIKFHGMVYEEENAGKEERH